MSEDQMKENPRRIFGRTDVWMQWLRGEAEIKGDWIVLKAATAELYPVPIESDLLFALVNLPRPLQPEAFLAFVKRFGLLRHGVKMSWDKGGPEFVLSPSNEACVENRADWEETSASLRRILTLYTKLKKTFAGGHPDLEDLRAYGYRIFGDGELRQYWKNLPDNELCAYVSSLIAGLLTCNMEGVEMAIVADATLKKIGVLKFGAPNAYAFCPHVPDLQTLAYYQLAQYVVGGLPVDSCPECSRFFAVQDKRMQYCSPKCAGRVRSRRHIAMKQ